MAEKYDFSNMFLNAEIKPIPNLQAELKPCPFCGGIAFVKEHEIDGGSSTYGIQCLYCYSQTYQFFETKEMAEKHWNARTKERGREK